MWDRNTEMIIQIGYWPDDEKIGCRVLEELADEAETDGVDQDGEEWPLPLIDSLTTLAYDSDEADQCHAERVCEYLALDNIGKLGQLHRIHNKDSGSVGPVKRTQLCSRLNERFFVIS